jgi:hypothetical protein
MNKARVSSVTIADRAVECLMLPDGSFRIAVSQVSQLLPESVRQNQASRDLKALLGKDSQFDNTTEKVLSELNPKEVNTITLEQFLYVLNKSAFKGNETAQEMLLSLSGASLLSVVSDAFGVKFTQEQTVAYVASRTEHLRNFHPRLTIWFKADGARDRDYPRLVNQFKAYADLPAKPVNEYSDEELRLANTAETKYCAYRKVGISHEQALRYL